MQKIEYTLHTHASHITNTQSIFSFWSFVFNDPLFRFEATSQTNKSVKGMMYKNIQKKHNHVLKGVVHPKMKILSSFTP